MLALYNALGAGGKTRRIGAGDPKNGACRGDAPELAPGCPPALELRPAAGAAMQETFPTTPRASSGVRLGATVLGLAATVLAARTTLTSSAWIGRVFPGFMILDNRVVASVGLAHWSGTAVPGLYQSEVVAVDGEEVTSTPDIYARVAALRPGTVVRYRLKHAGTEREVRVEIGRAHV